MEGFKFWIGKMLAEVVWAMGIVVILVIAALLITAVVERHRGG